MIDASISAKRILLVEDDPGARESIKLLLLIDRHVVVEAKHGREALACFAREPFDLVVLDYAMPGMRGSELATELRRLAPSVPILMVTAYLEKLSEADKPVDAVLGKPFGIEDLRHAVSRLFEARKNNQTAALHAAMTQRSASPVVRSL